MGNNQLTGVIYSILVEKTKGTLLRNWDDLDLWMLAESVEGSVSQMSIELNEKQQIVFEWLKSRVEAGYSCFDAVQSIRGFNSVPGKVLNAFMILDEKEKRLVLAAFSEWGMKNEQ